MVEQHDVLVVGSGFGGAVAACRLAQAGLDVGILERGRVYGRGDFPRTATDSWLWSVDGGPFDVRPLSEVTPVQAAGYGGGSLLYSNVHLRVPHEGFDDSWPAELRRDVLDDYYDLVAYMLEIAPVDESQPCGVPPRGRRLHEAAQFLGREPQFFHPPLAVHLGLPGVETENRFGVSQQGCTHCGECSVGCNIGAKNSLEKNYLALAERAGAKVRTRCEVTVVAPVDGRYELTYLDHAAGGVERHVRAPTVVLAAGAVNTTELLLRCRDRYDTLPGLSARLGERYSANGDFLAFALGTGKPFEPSVGPAICAGILHSEGDAPGDPWFLLQDGGFPAQYAATVVTALRGVDWFEEWLGGRLPLSPEAWAAQLEDLGELEDLAGGLRLDDGDGAGDDADPAHAGVFLCMGRDSSDGVLRLLPLPGAPVGVRWSVARNRRLYDTERRLAEDVADALGGDPVSNPGWRYLRLPMSVHNLGGAVMAEHPDAGVVDPRGEVFGHPGLFVLDGAALPRATGVNPAHTIAAVAERNVELLVRRLVDDPDWRAPERALAPRFHDPLPPTPPGGTRAPTRPSVGVRSRVSGRGTLARVVDGSPVTVELTRLDVVAPSVAELLRPPDDLLSVQGELTVTGLTTSALVVRVGAGVLTSGRRPRWTLPFAADGRPFVLEGWSRGTVLRVALRDGPRPTSPVLAVGTVRVDLLTTLWRTRLVGVRPPRTGRSS